MGLRDMYSAGDIIEYEGGGRDYLVSMPDREISRMTGRSVRAIQVMRHKMRKAGEVRTGV